MFNGSMSSFVFPTPLVVEGFLLVAALLFLFWILSVLIKNAAVVDIGWALGLVLLTWWYVHKGGGYPLRSSMILGMVTIWGLRLSHLLTIRILREKSEDKRYQKLRRDWGGNINLKFLALFEFEALLDIILAIPFLLIAINPRPVLWPIEIVGVLIWIVGLAGEIIADEQLKQFKANPQHKGKTCDQCLWYYSRHPNYFFEWLMWVGYFIFALASPWGWISFLGPVIMYHLLMNVTGVPFAEAQALISKGEDYRRYQQSTSLFIPLPKRKVRNV